MSKAKRDQKRLLAMTRTTSENQVRKKGKMEEGGSSTEKYPEKEEFINWINFSTGVRKADGLAKGHL